MTTTSRLLRPLVLVPVAVLAVGLLVLAFLAASGDLADRAGPAAGEAEFRSATGADSGADSGADLAAVEEASDGALTSADKAAAVPASRTAVEEKEISQGSVSLRARDVAEVRFDVQRVADEAGGKVTEEETEVDRGGEVARSRMVLRVPTTAFTQTMRALEGTGDLLSSQQGSDVVTDEYIDLQARVRAQEKSLERVEVLFGRARSIRDIMAIEGQLTRRQADLDALKGQLRWMDDQTSMATITVHLERTRAGAAGQDETHGFLAGLRSGWSAFTTGLTGLAVLVGWLLPFALAALVVGLPLWLLVRRARTRRRTPLAAE